MRRALFLAVGVFIACVGEHPDTDSTSSSSGGGSSTSGGPSARTVQCNAKTCAAGEVCCLTFGSASVDKAECTPESACTGGLLLCDGKSDCAAGSICCVETRGNSVQYGPSYCAQACAAGSSDIQLCNESSECESGSCVPPQSSVTPTNLKQCAPK